MLRWRARPPEGHPVQLLYPVSMMTAASHRRMNHGAPEEARCICRIREWLPESAALRAGATPSGESPTLSTTTAGWNPPSAQFHHRSRSTRRLYQHPQQTLDAPTNHKVIWKKVDWNWHQGIHFFTSWVLHELREGSTDVQIWEPFMHRASISPDYWGGDIK